jgi:hypothetical protein
MKTRQLFAMLTFLLVGMLVSCEYDHIVPERAPVIDPETPISFATQIEPIFNNGNNCTACHKTGATAPDLSTGKAFAAIVPALINTSDTTASIIYWHAHPSSPTHNWKKYTVGEATLILEWIKQGAKNN